MAVKWVLCHCRHSQRRFLSLSLSLSLGKIRFKFLLNWSRMLCCYLRQVEPLLLAIERKTKEIVKHESKVGVKKEESRERLMLIFKCLAAKNHFFKLCSRLLRFAKNKNNKTIKLFEKVFKVPQCVGDRWVRRQGQKLNLMNDATSSFSSQVRHWRV